MHGGTDREGFKRMSATDREKRSTLGFKPSKNHWVYLPLSQLLCKCKGFARNCGKEHHCIQRKLWSSVQTYTLVHVSARLDASRMILVGI